MQVLSIVNKSLKYTLTDKIENNKDKMLYTSLGLKSRV
jgi:hypothetical protein